MVKTGVMKRKKNWAETIFIVVMLFFPMLLFLVFYVGVNFNSIIMAFQHYRIDGSARWAGLSNFSSFLNNIFSTGGLLAICLKNSLKMYAINLVICMPLYIIFSYIIFKKIRLVGFARFSMLLPAILSVMIYSLVFKMLAGVPLQNVMKQIGLTHFPNILNDQKYAFGATLFYMIWTSFGGSLIIYTNAMNGIDPEIFESAKIDGVDNMFTELYRIILPLIFPTLITFLVLGFAGILTAAGPLVTFFRYNAPAYLYNMGYYYTVQVFNALNETGYPELAAGGLIMTAIVAPLTLLLKYFLERVNPVSDR